MNEIILDVICFLVVISVRYFIIMDICFDIESLLLELVRDILFVFLVFLMVEDLILGVLVVIFLCFGIFFGFCILIFIGKKLSE